MKAWNKIIGTSLMVSGTCIGAGMIGLPVTTAAGGFVPTISLFVIVWILMTFSALLMLEVSLCQKGDTNLISMARESLGKPAEIFAWITYVFFVYCLVAAYTASGSALLGQGITAVFHNTLHSYTSAIIYVTVIGTVIYMGARWCDMMNRFLVIGLVLSYLALSISITPFVETEKLLHSDPKFLFAAVPVVVTSFGFHLLIPSLKSYLNENINQLRFAIIMGSTIPLVVYFFWELVVVGVVPTYGTESLTQMFKAGEPVVPLTQALDHLAGSAWVSLGARFFSFFAVVSSFIGAALGLFDFFADGLNLKKSPTGKFFLAVCTFLPPLLFALWFPHGFVLALGYAGIFAAILLIIYPALMARQGRKKNIYRPYQVAGGQIAIDLTIAFAVGVVILEILEQLNLVPLPF